jgi:hypothetical protein
MRTTLNIEDAAFGQIKKYAEERGVSLGRAASDLVHRGAESLPKFKMKNGWVILERPPGSPPITSEYLEKIKQQEEEDEYRRAFPPRR